jgi:3-deoxy-D-manno-octulosonate 8-phosphate phosphatase KdsC-like HAD superfamily phosphatase
MNFISQVTFLYGCEIFRAYMLNWKVAFLKINIRAMIIDCIMFTTKKYENKERNKRDNVQMSYISKSIINIAKLTATNFVAITTRAEDVGVVAADVAVAVGVARAGGVAVVVVGS